MKKILLLSISLVACFQIHSQILTNYQGKIISKNGALMASPEGVIFNSVQPASIDNVTISLKIDLGYSVSINWGNGSTTMAIGNGETQNYTSNYTQTNINYAIQITGDIGYIKKIDIRESTVKFSSTTQLSKLTRLEDLYFNMVEFNSINIDLLPNTLKNLYVNLSASKGNVVGNISLKPNLISFDIVGQPNTLSGDISQLPNLTKIVIGGANTISGSISNLTNLNYFYVGGYNTISGSVSNLTLLTYLYCQGYNTLSGQITNLTQLNTINVTGSNSLSGSITNLSYLSSLTIFGANTVSGDVTNLPLYSINITGSNTITGDITNLVNLNYVVARGFNSLSGSFNNFANNLYAFIVQGTGTITGNLSLLTKVTSFTVTVSNSVFTGSPNPMVACTIFNTNSTSFSGNLNTSGMVLLTNLQIIGNTNISSFTAPVTSANLSTCYLYNNNIDKFDFSNTINIQGDLRIYGNPNDTALVLPTINGPFTRIDASGNALNQRSVDQIFSKLRAYFNTVTPTANLYINISGGTNAAPTGGWSNPDIVALDNRFSSSGRILTIIKN